MAGTEKIKGSAPRLIQVPGYHIHPQYDMLHLRHLLDSRKHKKKGFSLMLAPMVDLFSVLVIYLIMNFSTSGEIFFVSKDVVLPKAAKGRPIENFPLVSIVKNYVYYEADHTRDVGIKGQLYELNDGQSPRLRAFLKRLKEFDKKMNPKDPATQINLQADERTPVEEVKKVMKLLSEEGWTGINFIVDPSSGKKPAK